jgi:CheY-like chemotaxis protein
MGGSIHFESDPTIKPGTSCVVLLPLPVYEQPTIESICPEDLQPLQEALSFLVVDDIRMNRMMLERRIKKGIAPSCTIAESVRGEEALARCENERFDVIVVDQYMEGAGGVMLGTDVVREMRRMKIDSVIIGSSGNEMDVPIRKARTDWVWQKPIPPNPEIVQRLRGALAQKRKQ